MTSAPLRRAQLVAPFGVGAMVTSPDGISMITGGLDGWFLAPDGDPSQLDLDEYRVNEWRLKKALRVNEFRLPPDYRTFSGFGDNPKNLRLTVPFLRFPTWHFCPVCRALHQVPPHHPKRRRCPSCDAKNAAQVGSGRSRRAPFLAQVPFVAICDGGHLQDFPWRDWVHRAVNAGCDRQLRLRATGGASLASQTVSCECGASRNLARITEATRADDGSEDTVLSRDLSSNTDRYECRGLRPWVDDRVGEGCGRPIRGSLRAATNAYFAHVESAIYLPGGRLGLAEGLRELLEQPPLSNSIHFAHSMGIDLDAKTLRNDQNAHLIDRYSDTQVDAGLRALVDEQHDAEAAASHDDMLNPQAIRRPEYEVLRSGLDSEDLLIRQVEPALYGGFVRRHFSRTNLIEKLRETRVLYGFSRIRPDMSNGLSEVKRRLWQSEPDYSDSWLPAYIVHGEGIFFEFDEERLAAWETRPDVKARIDILADKPEIVRAHRGLADRAMIPRFVLLHTFAHLLINQLVFDCGYSSASLRERLFCSIGDDPMAGVLIYTAAGDSEGTMGGLVRMGRPGTLEPTLASALHRSRWCSTDPVCMELGDRGQGPGSLNLAACHACGLLPETACEVFNKCLDRGLVTGTHEHPALGFFAEES